VPDLENYSRALKRTLLCCRLRARLEVLPLAVAAAYRFSYYLLP
jgi:hypothetical protein